MNSLDFIQKGLDENSDLQRRLRLLSQEEDGK